MLNHRLIDPPREPKKFVDAAVEFLQKHAKNKKIFCALSGGIDSATTYLLLKEAKISMIPGITILKHHSAMVVIWNMDENKYIISNQEKQIFQLFFLKKNTGYFVHI